MLKIAGCILIFASCCGAGFIKAASYRARRAELENTLELVRLLGMEICYRKDSLKKTFETVSSRKECWFASILSECGKMMGEHVPLTQAWNSSLKELESRCPLAEKDIEILGDMSMGLGRSDAGSQKDLLTPAIARLEENVREAKEQELSQGRMYRGLGIAAGTVISIMLI